MRDGAAMDMIVGRLRKELPRNLHYHSVDHTLDVLDRVISLARAEGVEQAKLDKQPSPFEALE